jgi:hypothetical protein
MDTMLSDINDKDLVLRRKSVSLLSLSNILIALDLLVNSKILLTDRVTSNTSLLIVCYNPSNAIV